MIRLMSIPGVDDHLSFAPVTLALAVFAAAVVLGWLAGRVSSTRARWLSGLAWVLTIAASILLVVVGGVALAGHGESSVLGTFGSFGMIGLRVDALSGLFLIITFGVGIAAFLAASAGGTLPRYRLSATGGMIGVALTLVIAAKDLFLLIGGWELLGFAFYLAIGFDRDRPARGRASVLAAGFSKTSGALLLLGGGILVAQSGSLDLVRFSHHPGAFHSLAYALLLAGFAIKVGLIPAHIWLPPSYQAAPGPARAILAGVSVNVGFYGLWRTLDVLGTPPVWLTCAVLILAGLSGVLGIAHSAVHADLRGLIAWSSIENAGVIGAGFGVGMVGAIVGSRELMAVGLLAGTLQVITHALAKSLLFVAANGVESGYGTTDLDRLRGVTRLMPITGIGLVVGAFTLAGMPLTAGFASEWMTLEALMQQFRVEHLALQLCMAFCGILIALTIGIAGVTFVRLVGLTAFAKPDQALPVDQRVERSWMHRVAVLSLSASCLGGAIFAPAVVALVSAGLRPMVGWSTSGALAGGWILQPVFANFSALSPTLLWIVIPSYVLLTIVLASLFSGSRFWRVRRTTPWTSSSAGSPGRSGYTSYGFANPMRKVFAVLLLTRRELHELDPTPTDDSNRPLAATTRVGYVTDVTDVIQRYLYRPLLPVVRTVVSVARRLQSGRLDAYMAYMLIAVLAIVAVVTAVSSSR